jgi:hypothetical protein
MEDEEDKEAEKRAPLLQQTEFDYLRRFCEDESRNDGYFPFIMIDRVMKNQSFLENFFREHNNQLWKLKIPRHARESKSGAKCTVESKSWTEIFESLFEHTPFSLEMELNMTSR